MNTFKKTIFLSNKTDTKNKSMAILTLEKQNHNVFCTIKSYNLKTDKDLILGIKYDNNIIKQNILLNNNTYSFILRDKVDLNSNLGCVLLESNRDGFLPLLWGSEKTSNYKNQILQNLNASIQKIKPLEQLKKQNTEEKESFTIPTPTTECISPINSKETYEIHKNQCNINNFIETPKYSQISLDEEMVRTESEIAQAQAMESLFETSEEEIEEVISRNISNPTTDHKFYNMIAEQLDELFDKYPREKNLENLIDNSSWVKINHEEENKYYVVGIIYENDDIKYICYGVPGSYYNEPQSDLRAYSQWLPVDSMNPYDNGYWVMYQDADSGENIVIN